ncbi:Ubiquitin family [Phytophthora infestans]|uniref:Ubiquitin family n=1 Tax=Phytophthora infestans TaxID=4787 RepID=A0A8S9TTY9_PHYIN|nr:Ubiquitin family [Phytophthora infestans]
MGRFLGASPTASSERGRRYEMLPGDNEEDETTQQPTAVPASPSTAEDTRVTSPLNTASRSALMRSDSEVSVEETQHPTLQRQHQEMDQDEDTSKEEKETPETKDEDNKEDAGQQPEEDADPEAINVRILDLNGKFFNIPCRLDWTVAQMKQKVLESTEVAVASQRLIYRGRVLEDESTLDSYKVEDGHTIHLFVRAAPTPDPEILNAELNANGSSSSARDDGITVVNINSDIVSSAVFPSDSARRVDPLMLDSPLGNCARRVKLWSSFLLIIYTMKVMGQFALLANDQQQRAAQREQEAAGASEMDQPMNRYDEYPQYYTPDPLIGGLELMVHCFGVYVGCVGFKAAHDTDIRPIRFYCRGIVWLAILTVAEQIYTTVLISETDFPTERVQYPYGGQGPTKDDIVSANIFQTIMLVVMWIIAIRHSYLHQREVSIYNQSFAAAAMNAAPPVHLPEVV